MFSLKKYDDGNVILIRCDSTWKNKKTKVNKWSEKWLAERGDVNLRQMSAFSNFFFHPDVSGNYSGFRFAAFSRPAILFMFSRVEDGSRNNLFRSNAMGELRRGEATPANSSVFFCCVRRLANRLAHCSLSRRSFVHYSFSFTT